MESAQTTQQNTQQNSLVSAAQDLSVEEQKKLSQPLVKQQGLSAEDEAFLNLVVAKVDSGESNLLQPSTLINQTVYGGLSELNQGKIDFEALNLLSDLRTIYGLWKQNPTATYQVENMVHSVRLRKENLETISGDVFVI